jgi:hypothetical protein
MPVDGVNKYIVHFTIFGAPFKLVKKYIASH